MPSLDSSILLAHLTGVLERLTGVLDCLTGVLERLTGVLERLTGIPDLLDVGVGATGLDWVSGTGIAMSILRCIKVIIDKQSSVVDLSRKGWGNQTAGIRDHGSVLSLPVWCESCIQSSPCWGTLDNRPVTPC